MQQLLQLFDQLATCTHKLLADSQRGEKNDELETPSGRDRDCLHHHLSILTVLTPPPRPSLPAHFIFLRSLATSSRKASPNSFTLGA